MKEICKRQPFVNIFVKRIDLIVNLNLPTIKQNEHSEKYEDVEKFIDIGNWLIDEVDKKTNNTTFQCSIINKIKCNGDICLEVMDSMLQEYMKAFCVPPMYTLAMLRIGDAYRRHAVIYRLFSSHSRYGIDI